MMHFVDKCAENELFCGYLCMIMHENAQNAENSIKICMKMMNFMNFMQFHAF